MKDLRERAIRGGLAKVLAQAGSVILRVGSVMVLARLLQPTDFGLVAMVTAITGVFSLLKDFGLSTATVQRPVVTNEQMSTLFWINVLIGAFLCVLSWAAAPFVAAFYHEPRLASVMAVLAVGFMFSAAGVQHSVLLQRQMRFTTLSVIDLSSLALSIGVGVGLGASGFGYWALVAMTLSLPFTATAGFWLATAWLPGKPRRNIGIRSMMRFGGIVTLNSVVVYLAYNLEKVLLGRFWGAATVGLYGRAYQLVSMPSDGVSSALGGVAFSGLSRVQADPERFKRYFLKGYSLVLALTIPLTVGCVLFADDLILVVLGPKWTETAPIFRLLSPTILILALINPMGWLLFALGMVGRSLKVALVLAPLVISGYVIGLPYGPKGVALGYSAVMTLWVVPHIAWCVHGTVISFTDVSRVVSRPLLSSLLAGALAAGAQALYGSSLSPLFRLALGGGVLVGAYLVTLLQVMGQREFYLSLLPGLSGTVAAIKPVRSAVSSWAARLSGLSLSASRQMRKPRAGDWVEVRSREEILRSLDTNGRLDAMPFMPQMLQYCGNRYQVSKRAHKSCDTVHGPAGLRLQDTVHLEQLRCDGAAYGGCQAGCLIFWKTSWLKRVVAGDAASEAAAASAPGHYLSTEQDDGCTERDVWAGTRAAVQPDPVDPVYVCQATRLPCAARPLPWWDLRQYVEDYTSGNVTLGRLFRGTIYSCYFNLSQAGIGLGRPMRWLYDSLQSLRGGVPYPRRTGTIPRGSPTPARTLNLQPGELVRVKSHKEILATLNVESRNRGLYFDAEAVPYCGGTYRVARRVNRILDEKTGRLVKLKNDSVVLEGVHCQARYSACRMFCPRAIDSYWREIWLERVPDDRAVEPDSRSESCPALAGGTATSG